jgi:hypothetical protein
MRESLPVGTIIFIRKGRTEQRWIISSPWQPDKYIEGGYYGARRWIQKTAKWSGNEYVISSARITRVERV